MTIWKAILEKGFNSFFREGDLVVTWPDGTNTRYGDQTGAEVRLHLNDETLPKRILFNPDMAFGEGYVSNEITFKDDDLDGFLHLALKNRNKGGGIIFRSTRTLRQLARSVLLHNPVGRAQDNVAHHYDLSAQLYDMFLDRDRQYSCAYFTDPEMSLSDAQNAKKLHIAQKLYLKPGMRVLDIGCGWGGMALTLAKEFGVHVTGVTLSKEQFELANARVQRAGLSDLIDIQLRDYRHVTETYDRVVSVGMFEHVGPRNYSEFFAHLDRLMGEDGVALIHTIANTCAPQVTSPWVTKYIFPGGHIPSMSEIAPHFEKTDLQLSDVEIWRNHYAETLRHWHDRFMSRKEEAETLYDAEFVRMWRYYFKACEHTFRYGRQVVFQMQFTKTHAAAPLTRDYMYTT
ncbi:MAG: cyclopropane-fatty-acyl-phospholipid synthase family protein [Litoreibacter sp.]